MTSSSSSFTSLFFSPFPSSKYNHPKSRTQLPLTPLIKASSLNNNNNNNNNSKPTNGSWVSPNWLTSLTRSLTTPRDDDSNIPTANAKLEDVSDLLGGALFLPLFKWMNEYGPIYRLAAGPRNFVVVSDPAIAKHVLKNYGSKYGKGLVSEVSEFLFGSGFAVAEGSLWTVSPFKRILIGNASLQSSTSNVVENLE